jgi:hypothetical protein
MALLAPFGWMLLARAWDMHATRALYRRIQIGMTIADADAVLAPAGFELWAPDQPYEKGQLTSVEADYPPGNRPWIRIGKCKNGIDIRTGFKWDRWMARSQIEVGIGKSLMERPQSAIG